MNNFLRKPSAASIFCLSEYLLPKKLRLLLLIPFLPVALFAQVNLVPNPSFEDTIRCPTSINQSLTCVSWTSYGGSSDYFNACSPPPPYSVGVPKNVFGYQMPATGNAYCGLITYMSPGMIGSNIREHIGTQLVSPLVKGKKYKVSFKACRAIGGGFTVNIASNNIGVLFLMQPFVALSNGTVTNVSHVFTNTVITDTTSWTTVSGTFVADTNYKYIACGNFFNDANTTTVSAASKPTQAYYFVDDFSVTADTVIESTNAIGETGSSRELDVYPSPASGFLAFKVDGNHATAYAELLNAIGEVVLKQEVTVENDRMDLSGVGEGVYYLRIVAGGKVSYRKIAVVKIE